MAMLYKFNLVKYVQRPLVIDRRGGLFVFLALQPIVVVFSQPGSGL